MGVVKLKYWKVWEITLSAVHILCLVAILKVLFIDSTTYLYYIWSVYINIHLK